MGPAREKLFEINDDDCFVGVVSLNFIRQVDTSSPMSLTTSQGATVGMKLRSGTFWANLWLSSLMSGWNYVWGVIINKAMQNHDKTMAMDIKHVHCLEARCWHGVVILTRLLERPEASKALSRLGVDAYGVMETGPWAVNSEGHALPLTFQTWELLR